MSLFPQVLLLLQIKCVFSSSSRSMCKNTHTYTRAQLHTWATSSGIPLLHLPLTFFALFLSWWRNILHWAAITLLYADPQLHNSTTQPTQRRRNRTNLSYSRPHTPEPNQIIKRTHRIHIISCNGAHTRQQTACKWRQTHSDSCVGGTTQIARTYTWVELEGSWKAGRHTHMHTYTHKNIANVFIVSILRSGHKEYYIFLPKYMFFCEYHRQETVL